MVNVLVLSATAAAINYIRSLRDLPDVKLFVTDASPFAAGLYENGVTPFVVPVAKDLRRYREALETILSDHKIDVFIPTSDYDQDGVMDLLESGWNPSVRMFRPEIPIYRVLRNKLRLGRRLGELGFAVPKLYPDLQSVQGPFVIKPAGESGGKSVAIISDKKGMEGAAETLEKMRRQYGADVLLQEFIPGEVGSTFVALLLYDQKGKLAGEVATHSHLTQFTWGGGGFAGAPLAAPEMLDMAKAMIRALGGWVGPINLEFRRHAENGKFYLLEANCRLNGYSYLNTLNGLNFPKTVLDILLDRPIRELRYENLENAGNFVLGHREKNVERFVTSPGADHLS